MTNDVQADFFPSRYQAYEIMTGGDGADFIDWLVERWKEFTHDVLRQDWESPQRLADHIAFDRWLFTTANNRAPV